MKKLKIKMTDKQSTYLLNILRNIDINTVVNRYDIRNRYMYVMLMIMPIQSIMAKLYMNQTTISIDMSMAASLFMVFNSMDIKDYLPVLKVSQDVEEYITKIIYTHEYKVL